MGNASLLFITINLCCFCRRGKDEGLEELPISNLSFLISYWDGLQNQGTTYKTIHILMSPK